MSQTKLTVRVDRRWIEPAKRYAAEHQTSLSKLISEYLRLLSSHQGIETETPIMDRWRGILPPETDASTYREHWVEKHLAG